MIFIAFSGFSLPYLDVILVRDIWWLYWWPLLLLSILFFSRGWCGWLCPLGALSEFFNKFKFSRPIPKWSYLAWSSVFIFLVIIVAERFFGFIGSPKASAIFFIILGAFASLIGFLFVKRTWCKFFCPIGVFLGAFSRLGLLYFEATEKDKHNPKCGEVCPTFINLYTTRTNADCIMCFRCAKIDEKIKLKLRTPGKELMNIKEHQPKKAEAFFLIMVLGLMPSVFLLNKPLFQGINDFFTQHITKITLESLSLGSLNLLAFLSFILFGIFSVFLIIYFFSYLSALFIKKNAQEINKVMLRLFYLYTPMSFFGLFVITGSPLLVKLGYHQLTTLLALSIGVIWSSLLAYEIISKEVSSLSGIIKPLIFHLLSLSFLFTFYLWVTLFA